MIDPNKLDRKRVDELMTIANTKVASLAEGVYISETEKTCALINAFARMFLEEIDRELTEKEKVANRRKAPQAPDSLTGRGRRIDED